ncbi:uncharacterized protein LOC123265938 [Cotesia glomerata]|uniref:uncharacterized protein LOC123265938 n=1 Tax=Cotesia glomerata TaxID=32391 RepID=UPI001D023669|nr:uncharacterized protein LOC123265938 [Cotesia glomerata]
MQCRPKVNTTKRFFLKYTNSKCVNQPIGVNKIPKIAKEIAAYLNLPNPEGFTGHAFCRTSATLLVDAGADLTTLQRHGGWKSSGVAFGYVADSLNNKKKIYEQISDGIKLNNRVNHPIPTSSSVTNPEITTVSEQTPSTRPCSSSSNAENEDTLGQKLKS